jgi:lipopolysaccharide/colanic/teichoic acid biosynthesis glycosyltransferase
MIKRLFDILFSLILVIILSPLFIVVSIAIALDSRGGVFFNQERVGWKGKHFKLHKFRTMRPASESAGQITVGMRDPRITSIGYNLRKYKLDELPQLFNILKGEMSVVGPRPEVPRYVALYNEEQRKVLDVKPGLTDYASIDFVDENAILAKSSNPEKTYIEEIMPLKLNLNKKYIQEMSLKTDIKIIFGTIKAIFR